MGVKEKKVMKATFVEPTKFTQELNVLKTQLPSIIQDFKKYYVFYNKNPDYQEYQTMFQNIKNNLTNVNGKLFTLSNEVQSKTDEITSLFLEYNNLIQIEKSKNDKLKQKLGIIEDKTNASFELISNYKDMYNLHYLRNWGIVLSIIIVISTITKVYKNRAVSNI